ncbi:MAG TPA: hypothetical protein VLK65_18450 [Vicinamibacteria bacterium]|nr:hypothetical protein [Vicinamibacteria bacterium]
MYGRYVGEYGRCGEVFFFTRAAPGNSQFLDQVEFRYTSSELADAELAGKAILRAYGRPFEFIGEAYDEWRLNDDGFLRRDYTWTEPDIRVSIEIEQRDALFRLSMTYDRETHLDRTPPETLETPLKLAVALPDPETFAPHLMMCIPGEANAEERRVGSRLLRLVEHELARAHWFEIAAAEEADFTVLVGAHWEDTNRCISAAIWLPGQSLGLAITERGPGWRDLETLEEGARELATSIEARFREHYWRIRQFRP